MGRLRGILFRTRKSPDGKKTVYPLAGASGRPQINWDKVLRAAEKRNPELHQAGAEFDASKRVAERELGSDEAERLSAAVKRRMFPERRPNEESD